MAYEDLFFENLHIKCRPRLYVELLSFKAVKRKLYKLFETLIAIITQPDASWMVNPARIFFIEKIVILYFDDKVDGNAIEVSLVDEYEPIRILLDEKHVIKHVGKSIHDIIQGISLCKQREVRKRIDKLITMWKRDDGFRWVECFKIRFKRKEWKIRECSDGSRVFDYTGKYKWYLDEPFVLKFK